MLVVILDVALHIGNEDDLRDRLREMPEIRLILMGGLRDGQLGYTTGCRFRFALHTAPHR